MNHSNSRSVPTHRRLILRGAGILLGLIALAASTNASATNGKDQPAWKVRAGDNYGKNPLDKNQVFESIAFPAVAEQHVSLGLGWAATDTLAVNLAGTYSPKSTQSGADPGLGIASDSTSMSQYAIDLGVGRTF